MRVARCRCSGLVLGLLLDVWLLLLSLDKGRLLLFDHHLWLLLSLAVVSVDTGSLSVAVETLSRLVARSGVGGA